MQRIDYGASYKYYANPSLTLNAGNRAAQKAEFNLLSLNPFGSSLGLDVKAFTPSKLCSGLVPTDDSTAAATADAHVDATAQKQQQQQQQQRQARPGSPPIKIIDSASEDDDDSEAADDDKTDGLGRGQPDKPAAAAAAISKQQLRQQQQQLEEQQQEERGRGSASSGGSDSDSDDGSGSGSGSGSGDGPASDDDLEAAELASLLQDDDDDDDVEEDEQAAGGLQQAGVDDDDEDDEFIPLLPPVTPAAATTTAAAAAAASPAAAPAAAAGAARSRGPPGYRPPWLPRLARFGSPLLRLHNEVVAFAKMLEPTPEEVDSRSKSMKVLREVVASIWPSAVVVVFGSYETGLYTPASDTDVVIMESGLRDAQKGLRALAQALQQRQLVRNMQQVLTARVPIIKFEMVESGLAFDVSWEVPSGPQGAAVVKQLLQQWPVMKPLVLVLKVFLTQRELNEVYQGGIGSYSLIIMVAAFLQLHPSRRPGSSSGSSAAAAGGGGGSRKRGRSSSAGRALAAPLETNLGLLLVDFFRLYGRALNLSEVGVSCAGDGCFYSKAAAGFLMHDRPWALSVQDPLDPKNDTARNSYNIKIVRQVFDHAYQLLTAPFSSSESLLGRIIHLSPVVSGRPVPAWFDEPPAAGSGGRSGGRSGRAAAARDKHHGGSGGRSSGKGSRGRSREGKQQRHREKREQHEARKRQERKERKQQKRSDRRQQQEQSEKDEGHRNRGSRDREQQQQQQQDSREGGGSSKKQRRGSSGSGGGRDAAGRAGGATAAAAAGAGNEWQQQQQQRRRHHSSDSRSPGRKRQRR